MEIDNNEYLKTDDACVKGFNNLVIGGAQLSLDLFIGAGHKY